MWTPGPGSKLSRWKSSGIVYRAIATNLVKYDSCLNMMYLYVKPTFELPEITVVKRVNNWTTGWKSLLVIWD